MSQANDELVARAQDPNAPLETLHQLAQNYPSLRPHIAANPRTYPALLKWLGTLGDPDVDAALASRGASPTMSASSAVSAASAASSATMAPSGSAASATSAAVAGAAGLAGTAGTAGSATSAAVAGSAGAAATAASPASYQGHRPGQSYASPAGGPPGTPSGQAAGGAGAPVNGPASPYSAGGPSAASPGPRFGATQAVPAQPAGYQPRPPSLPAYQAASMAAGQQSASQASSPAGAPRRAAAGGGAAAGEATVFGVGTDVGSEEKAGGAPSGLFLWVLGMLVLALVVFAMTWYLTSNDNDPTSGAQGAQGARTTAAAEASQGAAGQASETPSATPSATPTRQVTAPAPDDAVELGAFTSPSGNITCVLGKTSVSCTINEYNFTGTDASCQNGGSMPFTASVGEEGQATSSCAEVFRSTGATLNYGASAKNETFACTSSDSGIACWNQYTGQGFTLSRDTSETTER